MAKKFTIKKHRLRARSRRRKHSLKVNPIVQGLKTSLQQENFAVIESLEAKVKAAAAK